MRILLLSLLLFLPGTVFAQIRGIVINTRGGFDVIVEVAEGKTVAVTDNGYVVDIDFGRHTDNRRGNTPFYGHITSVGGIDFEYHDRYSTFEKELYGKIRSIGTVRFDYYDNKHFNKPMFGKLQSAGNVKLDYYDDFGSSNRGKEGCIKSIGGINFDFWTYEDKNSDREIYGLLKSINSYRYDYTIDSRYGSGMTGGSGRYGGDGFGRDRTTVSLRGEKEITVNNVRISVIEMPKSSWHR